MSDLSRKVMINGHTETIYCTTNPAPVSVVLDSAGYDHWKYVLFPEHEAPATAEPITKADVNTAPTHVDLDEHDRFVAAPK